MSIIRRQLFGLRARPVVSLSERLARATQQVAPIERTKRKSPWKLDRRQLLVAAGIVVGRVSMAHPAFASIHGSTGAAVIPSVAPGPNWNSDATGAPGSGVGTSSGWADVNGVPLYPNRAAYHTGTGLTANAMPVLQCWHGSQLRSSGLQLVGFFADAGGLSGLRGVASVDFNVEGTIQNVTLSYLADTDVNGNARIRPGYWIYVDCTTARSHHASGAVRVYARANPVDSTITPRTIGPILVYPRALDGTTGTIYDFDKTVNSGGGADYTDIETAMRAMYTALTPVGSGGGGKECGRITITGGSGDYGSGNYEWGNPVDWNFPWAKGTCCIRTSSGVTVQLVRGSSFDITNPGAGTISERWRMYTYVQNLEFQGSGLVIDRKNFYQLFSSNTSSNVYNLHPCDGAQLNTGRVFFNGCTITNSAGPLPHTYWGGIGSAELSVGESNGNTVIVHADAVTMSHSAGSMIGFTAGDGRPGCGMTFNRINDSVGTAHQAPNFIYGEYYANSPLSTETYYTPTSGPGNLGATISYSGTATTATVDYAGGGLVFKLNGVQAGPTFVVINPQKFPGDGTTQFATWAQIVTYINAHNGVGGTMEGFSIVVGSTPGAPPFTPYWISNGANPFPLDVKAGSKPIYVSGGIHAEHCMWFVGPFENIAVLGVTCVNTGFGTSVWNFSATGANFRDVSFKNNSYTQGSSDNGSNGTNPTGHHVCIENCTIGENMTVRNGEFDGYSSLSQIACPNMFPLSSYSDLFPTNCVVGGTVPTGAPYNNVYASSGAGIAMTTAQWNSLFVDNLTTGAWNLAPKPLSALATNTFTVINPRDAGGNARASPNAAGAWENGALAPAWPF